MEYVLGPQCNAGVMKQKELELGGSGRGEEGSCDLAKGQAQAKEWGDSLAV